MALVLESVMVSELVLGDGDAFQGGRLHVDAGRLATVVAGTRDAIASVATYVVSPGEAARIHCCKDVVQPAIKLDGAPLGEGRSRVLENVAVVTCGPIVGFQEGFGNPASDFVMILGSLERAGIACVGVTDEFAGGDGGSQSLVDSVPDVRAIVSTGNANQSVVLPPMARTIGPIPDVSRLAGGYAGSIKADGSLEVELQAIMGATNELGHGTLSAREI